MKIGLGSDHNAWGLKEHIKQYLEKTTNHEIEDYGCYSEDEVDYPGVAIKVAQAVGQEQLDRAILFCGTGLGVAITANKYPGVRAVTTHDVYSAERAQLSNNAQIITMGAQVIGSEAAKKVVDAYLSSNWVGGSQRKVDQITNIENKFSGKLLHDQADNQGC